MRSIELTAPGGFLAQLQPIDGQPVGSSTQKACVAGAVHLAFSLQGLVGLNPVAAVALSPELQTGVHVASEGGGEKRQDDLRGLIG